MRMTVKDLIGVLKSYHEDQIIKVNLPLFDCDANKSRDFDFYPKVTDVRDEMGDVVINLTQPEDFPVALDIEGIKSHAAYEAIEDFKDRVMEL